MTHEISFLLLQSGWVYVGLTVAVVVIFALSWFYGARVRRKLNKETVEISSIFLSSIFGFFAILIAFQLSGSTRVYENQRQLTIDEMLSISAVIDAAQLLRSHDRHNVQKLLTEYIELRQNFYDKPLDGSKLEIRGHSLREKGLKLLREAYVMLPTYDGDDRIMFNSFLTRVQHMNKIFDQQYVSIFMQTPRILWQALIALLMIISGICGYKMGLEKGQQFGLTTLFLFVVLAAIIICLNLGNPHVSIIRLDLIDTQFPKLLRHAESLR